MGNIVLRIKTSQLKPHISGWKAQANLYVNDKYTKGLKYGAFVCAETGTADGEVKPTLRYAGLASATYTDIADTSVVLPAKAATGIVYESSARDIYASLINLSNESREKIGKSVCNSMIDSPITNTELTTQTDNKTPKDAICDTDYNCEVLWEKYNKFN